MECVYFVKGLIATNEEPAQSDYCKFFECEINGCCEPFEIKK